MSFIQEKILKIDKYINQNNYEVVPTLFENLIEELNAVNSADVFSIYYEYGMFLFDIGNYDFSITMLISAYQGNYKKEMILSFIYDSFVIPNEKDFSTSYHQQISEINTFSADFSPNYEQLPLDFIPISDTEYYIFDKSTNLFEGFINIKDILTTEDLSKISFADEFSDITIVSDWNITHINHYILSASNRTLYYISDNIIKTLSFFKIPNIRKSYLNHVQIFDSIDSYENYLHLNTYLSLPRIVLGNHSLLLDQVTTALDKEHTYRLTSAGRNTSNILLSVCIPSYDRGDLALKRVMNLLTLPFDSEIEFIISNNGSSLGVEEYLRINAIRDSRIIYYEFASNQGPSLNWLKTIDLSHGKYSLFLSDEDDIIACNLPHYLNILKNYPELGIIRSGTEITYSYQNTMYYAKGKEAFMEIFLRNNYLTGIIYKTSLFHKFHFFQLDMDFKDNKAYWFYPHLWWDAILSISQNYYQDHSFLCKEGENATVKQIEQYKQISSDEADKKLDSKLGNIFLFSKYEARLEQHIGFIALINQITFPDIETKIFAYLALCLKTKSLLELVKNKYIQKGYCFDEIRQGYYDTCIRGIDLLSPPPDKFLKDRMTKAIINYYEAL